MIETEVEVLVVGGGMAGCAAAFTAARTGRTLLLSAGGSATSLSSGCVDFLDGRSKHKASGFLNALGRCGLGMIDGGSVITGVGMERPTGMHQKWMLTLEEARAAGGVDIIHLPRTKASHPRLAVSCLRTMGIESNLLCADERVHRILLEHGDAAALGKALASSIHATEGSIIAFPPLWEGADVDAMLEAAELEGGCRFRELVNPAGPQGIRLQRAAERAAGASRLMTGCELRGLEFDGDRCIAAKARSGLREMRIRCGGVIMATGGPLISRPEAHSSLDTEPVIIPSLGTVASFLCCREGFARHAGRRLSNVVLCGSAQPGKGYLEGYGLGDCILSGIEAVELLEAGR